MDSAPGGTDATATSGGERADAGDHVVVVGCDSWTLPVLDELERIGASVAVVATDEEAVRRINSEDIDVVVTEEFDERAFQRAGIDRAAAVLVATMDDHRNVLAVLTVMNVDETIDVVSFAGEARDVPKLRAAGADTVISLGQVVGELLVEVALEDRTVDGVVAELVETVE